MLFGAIFVGFPIAFTLIAVALVFGYFALGPVALHLMTLQFFSRDADTVARLGARSSCSWATCSSSRA